MQGSEITFGSGRKINAHKPEIGSIKNFLAHMKKTDYSY
jgi:hypothetical protein